MLHRAVELRPEDGFIVDSLGWAYFRLGENDKAVTYLERAVELEPGDPVINDHLGDAYWRVGRTREARFQWQRALTFEPEPELATRDPGQAGQRPGRCAARPGLSRRSSSARRPRSISTCPDGRRADGYHELDSLVVFADIGDELTVSAADELRLEVNGPFAGELRRGDGNIVLRAARLAGRGRRQAGPRPDPARQAAAGRGRHRRRLGRRGGGLRGLRRLWRLPLDDADLAALGPGAGRRCAGLPGRPTGAHARRRRAARAFARPARLRPRAGQSRASRWRPPTVFAAVQPELLGRAREPCRQGPTWNGCSAAATICEAPARRCCR